MSAATKRLTVLSLLAACALAVHVLEGLLPPLVPIPGVRLGLSNIFSLVALLLYGPRQGLAVLCVRILLAGLFAGQVMGFIYSLAGGLCAYGVMCLCMVFFAARQAWAASAAGAVAHGLAQVALAAAITRTPGLWAYAPLLCASGLLTGVFTGLCAIFAAKGVNKIVK